MKSKKIKIIGDKIYYEMVHVATLNEMSMSINFVNFKEFIKSAEQEISKNNEQISELEKEIKILKGY